MRRRIAILLVATFASTFSLVGVTATPAAAYCIDTGIPGQECIWICPSGLPPGITCPA